MVYADTNINTIFCQRESGKDNKMVVIASGRFRNQMFQYAVAAIIAKKNKTKVLIDDSIFNKREKLGLYSRDFELLIFEKTFNFAQNNSDLLYLKPSVLNKFKRKEIKLS
jgi:hypothetical protein